MWQNNAGNSIDNYQVWRICDFRYRIVVFYISEHWIKLYRLSGQHRSAQAMLQKTNKAYGSFNKYYCHTNKLNAVSWSKRRNGEQPWRNPNIIFFLRMVELCKAPIYKAKLTLLMINHNIMGFHISMHNTLRVAIIQSLHRDP